MTCIKEIKNGIAARLNRALGTENIKSSDLVYPPNSEMGDLSLPCFGLAKEQGKNPASVAQDLVGKIEADDIISGTKTAGPYFNISLSTDHLASCLIKDPRTRAAVQVDNEGEKKKIMIEYSNANTHKEYHVGHLRNICHGDALNRILKANGFEVIPVSYINDFGIHVAKTIWGLEEFFKKEELPDNKGEFLGKVYVKASTEAKDNDIAKRLIEMTMKQIESRQGEAYGLWQKTRQWSIDQFKGIYDDLDVNFKHTFYESEYIEEGLRVVEGLKEKGILKESQGAIIADLEEYGLGVQVIVRSDGTAMYAVADLALAKAKFDMYGPDVSVYLTDIRQSLHFKQLFKILELAGFKEELVHLGYEFVKLPSGMMSSRSGNVITYEELKRACFKRAGQETGERHGDWPEEKVANIAKVIAYGAIKYEMIKVSSKQEIIFDIEKAMSFNGFTAAYLQYTFARISSIIRLSGLDVRSITAGDGKLKEKKEHDMLFYLSRFGEAIERAGSAYDPSIIAKYLFDLAQQCNDYYHSIPVLKSEKTVKEARLVLLDTARMTLKNGLDLLGIEVVEEM